MSGRATWRGMDAYRQSLLGWPAEVADQARPILEGHAHAAYAQIYAGYPVVTGRLRAGLTLADTSPSALHPRWTLENAVYYAKIFEAGGATLAGAKPQGKVFVPIVVRERREARTEVVDMLLENTPHG